MTASFRLDGKTYEIELDAEGDILKILLDGEEYRVDHRWISENELSLLLDGRSIIAVSTQKDGMGLVRLSGIEPYLDRLTDPTEVGIFDPLRPFEDHEESLIP